MDARQYAGAEQGRGPSYDNYGYREELASRLHRDWPNGQKQIYVSQSPLYDSWSSMPGEDSSSSSINCKRCCTIFGIILLMCGIIAGIVVAIYFSQRDAYVQDQVVTGTSITLTPTIPVPQAVLKQFLVSVTTEGNYTPALNDSSSKEFKEKAQSFQKMMDNIYKNSSLAGIYKETKVLGFSQGSIKVNFVIIVIIIPTSPTPAARNVTSSPSLDNSTQKTTTTTTRLPDPNIISNVVLQALREIIKENAVIMKVDLTKNDSIQITEITTTARPTTTPIRTTPKTIFISTSQRPDATKTRLPLPTSTTIREMVTESMRPRTETPILPHTEPSKPETSEKLTSIEPQLPTKQSTSTQELAPESTKPPKQFTTAPSNTNAPASQKTFPSVTTVSNVPTLGKTTLIQDITIVTQAYSKLATTEELPTQDITDHFTSAQNSTKTSLKFSRNYTVVTLPFSTSITPIKNQTSEPGIMYTGTTIKPFMTTTASLKKPDDCNPRLTSCENGQCIRHEWFCDNHVDCLDASDEDDVRCGRNTTKQNSKPESTGNELDCNFESNTKGLCNYEASPGVYNWRVKRGSTSSNNTGPDLDHTYMSPKGHFLFTESSYGKYNDNATLKSIPVATDNRSHSFTFYYHMNGAHMGSLVVYFNIHTLKGLQRVLKWKESGNHGNMWLKACIEMPKGTKLSVEFVAYRGLNYTSDIAIDDIKYSTDSCMSVSCTYEDSNCGHMPNFENKTNSNFYTWRRVRGNVMINKLSAPKIDFTQGMQYGAFLIADSKSGNTGDKAIFRTPLIRTSKTMALNFRLYISGTRVGEMQVSLLSQPNSISNITYQRRSITQGWERICVLVPKDFVGIAEFVAVRGDVIPGYIAVDDVALGPETMCNGFSTCQFESGIYCNFNITGKDYRWRRYNALKGHYLIASGKGAEGSNSKLVSPKFTPLRNSSISIRYAIQGTSVLSIWIREYMNGIQVKKSKLWSTEEMMTGVQTMPSMAENINSQANYLIQNTNKRMDWLTSCINMPIAEEISIEIVSRKIDQEGGEVALDWVNVNMKQCQIGLEYNACNFDEPNLCGYEIECPFNTQYKWKRISGSTPTSTTGPLRDHTFNNTIGHYLYTEGSVGRTGDKAMVTFTNIQTTINTSIRFSYYMSGRDIGALYIIVGKSGKISWIQEGNKSPLWYYGCVDLPSNKRVNVSFIGIHGNGPLSDIAIDDVNLSYDRCPARHISCNFENEMICGYTGLTEDETRTEKSFDEQWLRLNGSSAILPQLDHTLNSSKGHFLATSHLSKIMSPRIAYGQTTCLQFYYYIQLGKGQAISVTADYKDSKKNKVKIFGTNGFSLARWRHGQMNLTSGNISVIFSVGQYNQEISSTIFAIDDVSISYGMCPETVCSEQMFKCKQDDICIPNYKKCDWIQDCSDGADELNCPTNRSNIRLVDGITSGDKGRVEIYVNGSWGTAYSLRWFESNAKVACRQLGYTGFSKSVRFGKFFFGLGDVWQITCIGNETSLQDCDKVNVVNTISHLYDVGLACYNSACEPGKKACPKIANSSVVYCLDSSQFCDGDIDCPGEEDEKNCSNCQANEFTCKNHMCISKTKRCDGKPDCLDASDEMNCVRKDEESNVELYYNGNWTSLCSNGSNEALYSSLCLIMGQGVAKRKTVSSSNSVGLIPIPNPSKITAIGKYNLSLSAKPCPKLKLECYEQECGKRSQKKFEPFVQYGNQAVPTEYPWQAMLLRNGNFHCGASIFNSRWLITAEHCVVEKYVTYEVVAGLLLIQDLDKFPKIKVMDIIHSMNYASHKGIPVNDIALILLEKDLVFNDYIQPVCLPSKVYTAQDYCYLSGWGRDENLVGQSHLKETKVYAISNEVCKKYYDNVTDNSFICFRHNKPNMPSCYGDSGGPLVCRNDRGRFELVGVVSFGLPLCAATNGTPAAFTNVLNFRGWIVDQTRCRMWCPNGKCLYKAEICDGIDHCTDRSDESHPKCTPTVTCDFNKPYKCGYRNDSFNTWYWSSPHWSIPYMKAKPMTGRDTETEKYMLASVNATKLFPARIISPKSTEIPCISFTYIANASNTATAVLILKVRQQNSSFDKKVWNTNKNDTHEMIIWKLMTVSLPSMTTSIIFEAYYENPTEYSFIAIDSINVLDQNCTVCHSTEFQCNTGQCINARHVCDRILHCSDGSDELNCLKTTPPVSCSSDHFQCSNGECVLKDTKCNGIKDCTDGSDENQCNKPPGST